jgi:mono/diheme cytochrome c family protein
MCSSCQVNNVDLIGGGDRQSHRHVREQGQIEMPKSTAFLSMKMLVATAAAIVGLMAQPLAPATDSAYAGEKSPADPAAIEEGHSLFNQTCAHCHGPNAVTGLSERDLRRLRVRYGDDMPTVFRATIMQGRADKGMPAWDGVLEEENISRIYVYLETIQAEQQ